MTLSGESRHRDDPSATALIRSFPLYPAVYMFVGHWIEDPRALWTLFRPI